MNYTEDATAFGCAGETLLGVLARPHTPAQTGVVVVVGGPQYRVGSHRQFVLLSRALAAAGFAVLRFDYRGMGDSAGEPRNFESVSADIAAAIDALQARLPSVKQVALWGLCDGASAALLYSHETLDPRVSALCLLNPWVRSEVGLARTQVKHYYAQRLRQKDFWLKLVRGKVTPGALRSLLQKVRLSLAGESSAALEQAQYQQRMALAWQGFKGNILLILSGDDYTAKEFLGYTNSHASWRGALARANVSRADVPGVDHTFSSAASRRQAEVLTLEWLGRQAA